MIEVPWFMLSPSPYTLTVWFFLAYFQAQRLDPHSWREWIKVFTLCVFSLGLIVLPFDSLWVIFQSLRFGYLHPGEVGFTLASSLLRNLLVMLLCIYETRKVHEFLNWETLTKFGWIIIPCFIFWFGLAPDPSWTDWTYAWRFGYGVARTFNAFVISHVMMKGIQAVIYFDLWRVKVE